jgi:aminoglycoside phosphotransferase (APT) family kinase protein
MKEQWAVNAARKKRVPTPEILEVCNDIVGMPYMISRKVVGRPAETIGDNRIEVVRQLGHYTAIINSIRTHDYGHIFDWSPNTLSRNRTWNQYLDNELGVDDRLRTFRQTKVIDPANLKKLQAEVQAMRGWTTAPTLSHSDIRLKNVIVDERDKIKAILDWENCISQIAPYWELSIALHDLTMDEKEAFLAGYGLELKDYIAKAAPIKVFNMLNYARVARRAVERKDKGRLLSVRARLNGRFDLYSL